MLFRATVSGCRSGFSTVEATGASIGNKWRRIEVRGDVAKKESCLRRSEMKLNMAVMRRSVVATRGLEIAFFMWVSIVLLAVLPTLSTA